MGFAYITNLYSHNVSQYAIGVDGLLTTIIAATVAASSAPYFVTTAGIH